MQFRTETEILIELIEKAQERGLISDEEIITQIEQGELTNNQYVLDLSTHAYLGAQLEEEISEIYTNADINQATGSALDTLGELVNVHRFTAQPAMAEITISSPSLLEEDIVIPAGTPVILNEFYATRGYHILEEVKLIQGMDSVNAIIECDENGFGINLPIGAVTGLSGFETLTATNNTKGTNGRSIEDDTAYRERIKKWRSTSLIGTEDCINDYLGHYEGIDTYKLLPLYDYPNEEENVVGALTIICDTLEENLPRIKEDVYTNCMLFTDPEPSVILPASEYIQSFTLNVTLKSNLNITSAEIKQWIINMCQVYVSGGITRSGKNIQGMSIGSDFAPSQLERFLLEELPELENIYSTLREVQVCPNDSKLELGTVEVLFV